MKMSKFENIKWHKTCIIKWVAVSIVVTLLIPVLDLTPKLLHVWEPAVLVILMHAQIIYLLKARDKDYGHKGK